MIKYSIISGREMTPELNARWAEIQQADFSLASPYFRPEFTNIVAAVRDDVFVGLLENDGRVVGFFPFHRRRGGLARPIGLGLSDYHGVIAEFTAEWTAEELLHGCKLVRWEFDHLPISQRPFIPYHSSVHDSPIIEVSSGMKVFEASRDKSGRKQLQETRRKKAKLTEQIGPLTFTLHSSQQDILRQLINWKSEQCRRTGTIDFFALPWCIELIERIHGNRKPGFGGILACLHVDDTLAAVHFAMYSNQIWHSWFPAYNHELEEYSPGFILLVEMIQAASEHGIRYIDLGRGLSLYKKRVMTGSIPVAEGCLRTPSFRNRLLELRARAEEWEERSFRPGRFKPVLRRIIKRLQRKRRFD